jgi:nucleotide-binding universal stress UspA family protein
MQHILLGVDGSPASDCSVEACLDFCSRTQCQLTVTYVEQPPYQEPGSPHTNGSRATSMLDEVKRSATNKGIACETQVESADHVHLGLLAAAKRVNADLIVLCAHGRSGVREGLLGSVTHQVLLNADRPVLVFPATWFGVT